MYGVCVCECVCEILRSPLSYRSEYAAEFLVSMTEGPFEHDHICSQNGLSGFTTAVTIERPGPSPQRVYCLEEETRGNRC